VFTAFDASHRRKTLLKYTGFSLFPGCARVAMWFNSRPDRVGFVDLKWLRLPSPLDEIKYE